MLWISLGISLALGELELWFLVHSGLRDLQRCLRFVVVRLAEFWTQLEVLVGGARAFFFGGAPLLPLRECWYSIWRFETSGIISVCVGGALQPHRKGTTTSPLL